MLTKYNLPKSSLLHSNWHEREKLARLLCTWTKSKAQARLQELQARMPNEDYKDLIFRYLRYSA